jgi:hypothetical protein
MIKRLLKNIISSYRQYHINKTIIQSISQGNLFKYKGFCFTNKNNEIRIEFSLLDSDHNNLESILVVKIIPEIIRLGGSIKDVDIETDVFISSACIKMTRSPSMEVGYNVIFKLFVQKDYHVFFPGEFKNIFKGFISKDIDINDSEFRFLINLWKERNDLKQTFGAIDLNSLKSLMIWWIDYGVNEYNNIDVIIESDVKKQKNQLTNTIQYRDWLSLQLLGSQGFELGPGFQPLTYRRYINVKFIEKDYFIEQMENGDVDKIDVSSNLISCDIESANFLYMIDNELDFISSSHVFEHLHYPLNFIENITNRMKKGSQILFIIPDRDFTFDQGRSSDSFEYYFKENNEFSKPTKIENVLRAQKFYEPNQIPDSNLIENLLATTTHFYSYNLPEFVGLIISQIYHGKVNVKISNLYSPFQVGYKGLEFGIILSNIQGIGNDIYAFGFFSNYISLVKNNNIYSEILRLDDLIKTLNRYCSFNNVFEGLSSFSTFEYVLWFLNQEFIEKNFTNMYSLESLSLYQNNISDFKGVNRAVYSIRNNYKDSD